VTGFPSFFKRWIAGCGGWRKWCDGTTGGIRNGAPFVFANRQYSTQHVTYDTFRYGRIGRAGSENRNRMTRRQEAGRCGNETVTFSLVVSSKTCSNHNGNLKFGLKRFKTYRIVSRLQLRMEMKSMKDIPGSASHSSHPPPSPTIYASTHLRPKSPVAMIDMECDAKMQIRLEVANLQAELDWLRQQLASSPEDLPIRQSVETKPKIVLQDRRLCPQREVKLKRGGTTGHITLPPASKAQIDSLLGRPSLPSTLPKIKRDLHQQHLQQPLEASTKAQPHQEKRRFAKRFQQTAKHSGSSYAAHALLHQIGSSSRVLSKTTTRNRASLFSAIRQRLYDLRRTKLMLQDEKIATRSKTTTVKERNQRHATMVRVPKAACYHSRSSPPSGLEEVRKVDDATRNELSHSHATRHATPSVFPRSNTESVGIRRSDTGIQNQVASPSSSFPTKTGAIKMRSPLDVPTTSSFPTKTGPFKTGSPLDIPLKRSHTEIRVDTRQEDKGKEHSAQCQTPAVRDAAFGAPSLIGQKSHAYLQSAIPKKQGGTPVQYLHSCSPQDLEFKTESHVNLQSKSKLSRTPECKPGAIRNEPPETKKSSPQAIDHGGKTTKQPRTPQAPEKPEEGITPAFERLSGFSSRITSKELEMASPPPCQSMTKGGTNIQTIISRWDAAKPFLNAADPDVDPKRGKGVRAAEKPCRELSRRNVASVDVAFQDATSPSQPMPIRKRDAHNVHREECHNKTKEALPLAQATSKQRTRILAENGCKATTGLRSKGAILDQIRNAKHLNPLAPKPEGKGAVLAKPNVLAKGKDMATADFLAGIKAGVRLKHVEDNLESNGTCSEPPPTLLDQIQARKKELRQLKGL
jgi:hypothetical protein